METQTLTQIINVQVGGTGGLATTGTSILTILGIGLGLITVSILIGSLGFAEQIASSAFAVSEYLYSWH